MHQYTAAVVGTGPEPDNPVWGESAAMAYRHCEAYRDLPGSELIACADIVRENADAFAAEFGIPDERVYEDATEMLSDVEPDVVSICTPVPTHAPLVLDVVETGVPRAIHCEKPMADTWADSRRMAAAAADAGIQLTFNHQRRFGPAWRRASELLDGGAVGDLSRVEIGGKNLYDDGVHGFASTGRGTGADAIGCECRLLGESGAVEVHPHGVDADLRYRSDDADGWIEETHEAEAPAITLAIEHVLAALAAGEEPELSATKALRATELIFAAWESARSRGRVDLPLQAEGNALTELVETGELRPE